MRITIDEIQKIEVAGDPAGYLRVYVKVTAMEGDWRFTEEFHIGRQVEGRRIQTDANGFLLTVDGRAIDPETMTIEDEYTWLYEPVTMDFRAEILDVIRATMQGKLERKARQDPPDFMRAKVRLGDSTRLPQTVQRLTRRSI